MKMTSHNRNLSFLYSYYMTYDGVLINNNKTGKIMEKLSVKEKIISWMNTNPVMMLFGLMVVLGCAAGLVVYTLMS